MTRDPREVWQQTGSKDLATVIQEKLKEILENHKAPALADKTLSAIRKIREKGEKSLVSG
jgi:trimethylamine:corrinoid methyltransferase-like protein